MTEDEFCLLENLTAYRICIDALRSKVGRSYEETEDLALINRLLSKHNINLAKQINIED